MFLFLLINCSTKDKSKDSDSVALLLLSELPIGTAVVTTFAGSSQAGAVNGPGTSARFSSPANLQTDSLKITFL
jgi:hypothetical protein